MRNRPTTCDGCGGACCRYITIAAPWVPTADRDFLLLRGTIDYDQAWRIPSPCKHLGDNGRCGIYETRPMSCKLYEIGGVACMKARKAAGV